MIFSNAVSNSSSKLERLFYPVSVKRDIRALNLIFERAFENDTPNILEFVSKQFGQTILWTFVRSHYWLLGRYSGSFLSVNRLSLQVEKSARKTRTYLSVDQLSSEFSRIHAKETHKSFDPTKATALVGSKDLWVSATLVSVANNEGKLDFSSFEFPVDFWTKETYEKWCTGK